MKIKTLAPLLAMALMLCAFCGPVAAQSTNSDSGAATPGDFLDSFTSYFTTHNTNATEAVQFTQHRGAVWTGADYQGGINIDSCLGIEYQPWTNLSLSIGSVTRNAAIAGVVQSEQIDAGWNINVSDTQLTIGAGGGDDFSHAAGFVALYGEVKKALTKNTFAGMRLEEDVDLGSGHGGKQVPIVSLFAGFVLN